MIDQTYYPWNEGQPTKPDVDLLMSTWPDPKVDDIFNYDVIENLIKCSHESTRFWTVCNAWRTRMLRDKRIVVECSPGSHFYVASLKDVAARTYGVFEKVRRVSRKHVAKLASTKPKDDSERNLIEHQLRLSNALAQQAKKSRMNYLPSTEVAEQPKISPPKAKGSI